MTLLKKLRIFKRPSYIDPFQLESLVIGFVGFHFFNLSKETIDLNEKWQQIIQRAQTLSSSQAFDYILENCPDRSTPIVLVCERGRRSGQMALRLEKKQLP